ncbi:TPA: right-handed parallel beta-helix repeat-containing protein [Bacillus cereus]
MADAPKLLPTDSLRVGYPKINQAIDNANESLNTANGFATKIQEAPTSAKRTKLGEFALSIPKSLTNYKINIDFTTMTITIPPQYILYRGLRIDGGNAKTISYDLTKGAMFVVCYNSDANYYYVRPYYTSTTSYSGEQDLYLFAFTHNVNFVQGLGNNYTINGKEPENYKIKKGSYYVSPNGSDSNDGLTKDKPFKTFNRAIAVGAKVILAESGDYWGQTIIADSIEELRIMLSDTNKPYSSYDRPVINLRNSNGFNPVLDSGTGLYKYAYTYTPGDRFDRVFISKTLPPLDIGERSNGTNACVWETGTNYENDVKLTPVLTLTECQSKPGSFFYDETNIFINPNGGTITDKTYRIPITEGNLIQLKNIKKLVLEDIKATYGYEDIAILNDNNDMVIRNCEFSYSAIGNGVQPRNSNGNFYKCKTRKNRNDGFNIQIYGDTHFYDCEGMYNGDDGISHHDGCTGSITGGEYHHNGKGGISPAHGCEIDLYNVISHDNAYGFYIVSTGDRPKGKTVRHVGCVSYNNTQRGIYINGYKVLSYNCKHTTNTTPVEVVNNSDSALTEL